LRINGKDLKFEELAGRIRRVLKKFKRRRERKIHLGFKTKRKI
jgi:phosphoenolpyruvate carboxylase